MAEQLIPLGLSAKWIERLYKRLRLMQKSRREELDDISKIVTGNPLELARCYVEPNCQDINPADNPDPDFLVSKDRIMTKINEFFRYPLPPDQPGRNQLIVLADAGMGKSALLAMLKLMDLTSFWPRANQCILMKLGETTLAEIEGIRNHVETTLLLDSLDEDPQAYGRVRERLIDILRATRRCHRVIITCRTAFFPELPSEGRLEGPSKIEIGGFDCPTKYLSYFDEAQVEAYLKKRFPNRLWVFPQKRLREQARDVIARMSALQFRPMLLAYIRELMAEHPGGTRDNGSRPVFDSQYKVYEALVRNWLKRQEVKTKTPARELLRACELLATEELVWNPLKDVSEDALKRLVARMPDVKSIEFIDMSGRSLLNRKSNGAYRFAHGTFLEFLTARRILTDPSWNPRRKVPRSDLLLAFLFEGKADLNGKPFRLKLVDLEAADLRDRDLSDTDLSDTDLSDTDLSGANLSGGNLSGAILAGADLSEADLTDAKVADADFTGAKLAYRHPDDRLRDFETINLAIDGSELGRKRRWAWHFTEELAPGVQIEMVKVPAGRFTMGAPKEEQGSSDDERPQHDVILSSFYIGKFPITQSQWRVVADWPKVGRELNPGPSYFKGEDRPVEEVSWGDAIEFCARLSAKTGRAYRLPSEAEWEYACRAGTTTPFAFGETVTPEFVNYNAGYGYGRAPKGKYRKETVPVGSLGVKKPDNLGVANGFGLYDMHGNVWEWCQDVWHENYKGAPGDGSVWEEGGDKLYRVVRGGSWDYYAVNCRSALRSRPSPVVRSSNIGFRVVAAARTP